MKTNLKKSRARAAPAWVRGIVAAAVLALFLAAYFAAGNLAVSWLRDAALKTQFSAQLYGGGLFDIAVIAVLAVTLIFGRVFCSVLCPLGTAQELVFRIGALIRGTTGRRKAGGVFRPGYKKPAAARFLLPLAVGAGLVFSFTPLMIFFDPLSNFGRGLTAVREVALGVVLPFTLVLASFCAVLLVAAFFLGRAFCRWCPVGVTFELFAQFAPFNMRMGPSCTSCGRCEKECPARCIDTAEKRLDGGRCILCFSCAAVCPQGAAGYGLRRRQGLSKKLPQAQYTRRDFLRRAAALSCGAAYLLGVDLRRILRFSRAAGVEAAANSAAAGEQAAGMPILPPGARNIGHYRAHCIGCQACVAACPAKIIRARSTPNPTLDYTEAYCQYNCIECGKVCPTHAIVRLDIAEKHRTRIALSSLIFENCVVKTKDEACGACAEVCPTRAVRMVPYPESGIPQLTRPVFDEHYCIGCGACLVVCPAEPKAFRLSAAANQTRTPGLRPTDAEVEGEGGSIYQPTEDFPF